MIKCRLNTKQRIAYSIGLFAFALPLTSHAYDLSDHKRITLQAAQEFSTCFPGKLSLWDPKILYESDLDEDLNLARKDLLYSHFYNPDKTLKMFRFDSSVRVGSLQTVLADPTIANPDRPDAIDSLGHAIHHLQDAATPAHVVPVMHGPWDGFEAYGFGGDISSGWNCQQIAEESDGADLLDLLKETARKTLANIQSIHVIARSGASERDLTGEMFWQPSTDQSFGNYGVLGNSFGQTHLKAGTVPASFYDEFKQGQLKLAVRSSIKALYWYFVLAK